MSEIKIIGDAIRGISEPSKITQTQKGGNSFEAAITNALNDVSGIQNEATKAIESFARGEIKDIHTVAIAVQKADLSLQTLLQVRNKLLTAYQQIMRMQV